MEEIWKDIPNYEGMYQVSSFGNVRSLDRIVLNQGVCTKLKGKTLSERPDGCGYNMVYLCRKGKMKSFKTHQLVGIVFLGHKPCHLKRVLNHKNFIRNDNRIDNLEIVTMRENGNQKHIKSSSKYIGVSWDKQRNKWTSKIWINGKTKNLGRFNSELEAALAYQEAIPKL